RFQCFGGVFLDVFENKKRQTFYKYRTNFFSSANHVDGNGAMVAAFPFRFYVCTIFTVISGCAGLWGNGS
ncbi:MAG: hypothetical protein WAQ76_08190, partial [Gemmiger qucibialis]